MCRRGSYTWTTFSWRGKGEGQRSIAYTPKLLYNSARFDPLPAGASVTALLHGLGVVTHACTGRDVCKHSVRHFLTFAWETFFFSPPFSSVLQWKLKLNARRMNIGNRLPQYLFRRTTRESHLCRHTLNALILSDKYDDHF